MNSFSRFRQALLGALCSLLLLAPILAQAASTLVLYDTTGDWGFLGESYAIMTRNLALHFGTVTVTPVNSYTAGRMNAFSAVIYVGSTFDEPLPQAFLTDVLSGSRPVLWMNCNIWQLTAADPGFAARYGWMWWYFDGSQPVTGVQYKGRQLTRNPLDANGIMTYSTLNTGLVSVVAQAVRADGSTVPWALRSGNLTYIGETPYTYISERDRYLVLSDMLFDLLAPATVERHSALVRIEDVGPDADPAELRALADYFYGQKIPFSVATYTTYVDPLGVNNGGIPETLNFTKNAPVVSALKYMVSKGGTLISHGQTHQFGKVANPYDGVSGNDFEFYQAHVDTNTDYVVLDGPVPGDSLTWANNRMVAARKVFSSMGLAVPTIFEFPHYAASMVDYQACKKLYATRYERALYVPGLLSGTGYDYTRVFGQFFPYVVTDIHGAKVIPENLGNIEPEGYNQHPPRLPAELIASAEANLVVRDGFASFFYHPFLGLDYLRETVDGIRALGYTFVSPATALK